MTCKCKPVSWTPDQAWPGGAVAIFSGYLWMTLEDLPRGSGTPGNDIHWVQLAPLRIVPAALPRDGSQILTGSGVPSNSTGADGDFYLRTSNGDYYKKATGAWGSALGNFTGAAGAAGTVGPLQRLAVNVGSSGPVVELAPGNYGFVDGSNNTVTIDDGTASVNAFWSVAAFDAGGTVGMINARAGASFRNANASVSSIELADDTTNGGNSMAWIWKRSSTVYDVVLFKNASILT